MATIKKTPAGYRAFVKVGSARPSQCFRTKREAEAWAAATETKLRSQIGKPASVYTLADALNRYRDSVSPTHKGFKWESARINHMLTLPISTRRLDKLTPDILGIWRDTRLTEVSAGSVIREAGLLSAVLEEARREWRWLAENPMRDVRKPPEPNHREITITPRQVLLILRTMKHSPGSQTETITQSCARIFLIAIRTGMRAGEICGLKWSDIHADYCHLPETKSGYSRSVPLSKRALRILNRQKGFHSSLVFNVKPPVLDALFRKAKKQAGLQDQFTFHDTRHTAATMLSGKLDVLDLCKMFGWRNTKQALTYYNPAASDIAKKL